MITALVVSAGYLLKRDDHAEFLERRASIVMRDIGHRILLHAGDSLSRILPVQRMSKNIFQIEFQSPFTFMPDTLVKVVHAGLANGNLPLHYLVYVRDYASNGIVYGYEIGKKKETIVPCRGRPQPMGRYKIQIVFIETDETGNSKPYLVLLTIITLSAFAFVGRNYLKRKQPITGEVSTGVPIGKYFFYAERRVLKYDSELIQLSDKESKLLKILVSNKNEVTDRDRLMKEVWEDEGVFVGRSLDVFISKLRKKLQKDVWVKIVNVHGKGYRLEVGELDS